MVKALDLVIKAMLLDMLVLGVLVDLLVYFLFHQCGLPHLLLHLNLILLNADPLVVQALFLLING